jgi:hypothetical protein
MRRSLSAAARAPVIARRGRSPCNTEWSVSGDTAAKPSIAPRWKIATRTLRRCAA